MTLKVTFYFSSQNNLTLIIYKVMKNQPRVSELGNEEQAKISTEAFHQLFKVQVKLHIMKK